MIKTGAGRKKKDDEEKRRERGRRIAGEELGTIDDAASIDCGEEGVRITQE